MQKFQSQIHSRAGVTEGMNLRLQRKKLMKLNAKEKNGTGEILHLVKISFAQTQNGWIRRRIRGTFLFIPRCF